MRVDERLLRDMRHERLLEMGDALHQNLRESVPFLLLMEGQFMVQNRKSEDDDVILRFLHPVSQHVLGRLEFRLVCDHKYLRQKEAFPSSPVNLTVLGQAMALEVVEKIEMYSEDSTISYLHVLPIAIY